MGLTVYAQNMGFFHKGSGGKGIAPGDVCMTPPPPPAGPIPVPYVNIAQASDLTKGSKTVKIDGEPTALEDVSECSTSSGNEPGSQPPKGVVTATNKGKASFKLWSFTVKVEGKGVCRHGDMMVQNTASDPPNCIDAAAMTQFKAILAEIDTSKPCEDYVRGKHAPKPDPTPEQVKKVNGKPCWECKMVDPSLTEAIWDTTKTLSATGENQYVKGHLQVEPKPNPRVHGRSNEDGAGMTHDHQPPMNVAWKMGGCHMKPVAPADPTGFQKHFGSADAVVPHCSAHASSQGGTVRAYAADMG
jgi:uncharacterized Zn-binding protein involved in type VI secretion